jgi:hypothetical protein
MVRIYNVLSLEGINKYGVPQGGVLRPILFLLYIKMISDLYLNELVVYYTDDTCLLFSDNFLKGVHRKATVDVNKVYQCLLIA